MEISQWIQLIKEFYAANEISALLIAAVLFLLFLLFWQRQKMKRALREAAIIRDLASCFQPTSSLEKAGLAVFKLLSTLVIAEGYYLYIFDPKSKQYFLKASRHAAEAEGNIAPSYSGLLPYKKETYIPPLNIRGEEVPASVQISKAGQVRYLAVPVKGGKAVFHLAPVKSVSARDKAFLNSLRETLEPLITNHIELEGLRTSVDTHTSSHEAMRVVTTAAMDFEETLKFIMKLSLNMVGATGGSLLIAEKTGYQIKFISDLDEEGRRLFSRDSACHELMDKLLKDENLCALSSKDKEFYQLPPYLVANGINFLILARITSKTGRGLAVYWYQEIPVNLEVHRFTGLQMMIRRVGDLLDSQKKFNEISSAYVDILKVLVQTVDNLDPHTVGYSDLMARYAEIVAKELGLVPQDIRDIAEAAYLSNIGLVGFSQELFFKSGKYSEMEYESMKLHAQTGAQIVEATTSNKKVAAYVLHHHERMDGNGYPAGLKGEEIPLGARIISVVQTFLAAINGRKDREPKSFNNAISMLRSAAGSQLDTVVVEALINWFHKKQSNPRRKGRSLGPCWEMKCVPESICRGCPAYGQNHKNCWEIEGVLCASGTNCRTCFVYTEYLYRMAPKAEQGQGAG